MVEPVVRFLRKVTITNHFPLGPDRGPCWEWAAYRMPNGYGTFAVKKKKSWGKVTAHRFAYEQWFGPIPDGLEPDHLCRNRGCVSPFHLELVTRTENTRRGLSGVLRTYLTHCKRGHPFDASNTILRGTRRECRRCKNSRSRRFINDHKERYAAYSRKYYSQRKGGGV